MRRIDGIDSLLEYLENAGYPLTNRQVEKLLAEKALPHVRSGKAVSFYESQIDWWIRRQHKKEISE
ncbi:hypothetical protein [Indiicoccus explosivorum]|uniref:hypothetical protein n=1 Tax=Indiicoccus explosivorum TaxID=1917864 RepID=UPI000B44F882|nr:hypothetical protein [Indiicoccus explosivorum]